MNRKFDIITGVFLLIAAGCCLQSCQQEDLVEPASVEQLIAQGHYLTARSAESAAASGNSAQGSPFEVGTPYRLLSFVKAYGAVPAETPATHFRFNKVAWEGKTPGELRYINIDSNPDRWFGFSALDGEPSGTDGLVSLDFYGFTYGKPDENHTDSYISLSGGNVLADLKRTETVTNGKLNDLLRGELRNCDIATAGVMSPTATQSIMPFTHCFSQLIFRVAQQPDEGSEAEGNPRPSFEDIHVEKVEVTGTYNTGSVYLSDGKVELSGRAVDRTLKFNDDYKGDVGVELADMGEMLVFPSDAGALKNFATTGGYKVGLKITVKSSDRETIEQILANSNPENLRTVTGNETDGWTGTVVKESLYDYVYNKDLYFKPNAGYVFIISFQNEAVRIITVIPQIEEWIPGEGNAANPWQEQQLGQPQMFDNVVWSDRNLGADHFDPRGTDYEKTVGYFYQTGRNIPYYPFDTRDYATDLVMTSSPIPSDKYNKSLADVRPYSSTTHRFFPMVDPKILNMRNGMAPLKDDDGNAYAGNSEGWDTWCLNSWEVPQMSIPEEKPKYSYFDYMKSDGFVNYGLGSYDRHWENGRENQPSKGSWVIPSSEDFMKIFPSTPHAGNITFRTGGNNSTPMYWGVTNQVNVMGDIYKVLRVTVPYYEAGMSDSDEPADRSDNYRKAWLTLHKNEDAGTTAAQYTNGSPESSKQYEPDGDPEDGYASVYIISRDGEDNIESLPSELNNDNRFVIKSWGTIYAVKRVYTSAAYRMRWRVVCAGVYGKTKTPGLYIEICRYRCNSGTRLTVDNYMTYDWEHPAARLYFPICGLGDFTGNYINFGTECQYSTSDAIKDGKMSSAVQIKITGDNDLNAYMAIVKDKINRNFGKQIRLVGGVTDR